MFEFSEVIVSNVNMVLDHLETQYVTDIYSYFLYITDSFSINYFINVNDLHLDVFSTINYGFVDHAVYYSFLGVDIDLYTNDKCHTYSGN